MTRRTLTMALLVGWVAVVPTLSCGSDDQIADGRKNGTGGASSGGAASGGAAGSGGSAGTAGASGAAGSGGAPLPTGKLSIGFWCGLPASELTQPRVDQIAQAGFTFAANACDGTTFNPSYNQTLLALAVHAGIDVVVSDTRTFAAAQGTDVDANLDAVVNDYAGSSALLGYHVTDEPGTAAFPALATVVSGLATRDPAHFGVINLLPDYATGAQLGAATYPEYVAQFLSTVKPAFFSYDHYNFLSDGTDGPSFFANLAAVRAAALDAHVPFGQYIQSISYNGHRATTGPEKRWAALHTLAYGGSAVMYFTYWTPPQTSENFGDGIIGANGNPTAQYDDVTSINRTLSAMGKYLVAAASSDVFHNGPLVAGTVPRAPGAPVYLPSGAPITVGIFDVGDDGYALLVNRDHDAASESDVYFASAGGVLDVLDVTSGAFVPATSATTDAIGTKLHVSLPAGDGLLVHLHGPLPAGPPGAEAYFGTVRADAGWLDVVDSAFGTARLRGAGWDDCPAGTVEVGKDLQSNGFWLCARSDLAKKTFYVGNVVADAGTLYQVSAGTATNVGPGGWDTCPAGTLLAHRFESNGFWACME